MSTLGKTAISEKKVLLLSTKSIFEVNRPDPARPALYLRTCYSYGFQILTQCLHTVYKYRIIFSVILFRLT